MSRIKGSLAVLGPPLRWLLLLQWVLPALLALNSKPPFRWVVRGLGRLEQAKWPSVAVFSVLTLVLLTVLREINGLLRAMHSDAGSPYGGHALGRPFHWPDPEHARSVIATWNDLGEALTRSARTVFLEYAVVDCLFAIAYTVLIGILLLKLTTALSSALSSEKLLALARDRAARGAATPPAEASPPVEAVEIQLDLLTRRIYSYERAAVLAFLALPVLLLTDLAENAVSALTVWFEPSGLAFDVSAYVISALGHTKLALVLVTLVPGLVAAVFLETLNRTVTRRTLGAVVVLRGQILLMILLAAALFASDQSTDSLRRWRDDVWDGVWASALVLLFALLTLALGGKLLTTRQLARRPAPDAMKLVVFALLLAVATFVLYRVWDFGKGLWVAAALMFVVGVFSAPIAELVDPAPRAPVPQTSARALLGALAGTAPMLLGLAVIAAATPGWAYDNTGAELAWSIALVIVGLGLVGIAGAIYRNRTRLASQLAREGGWVWTFLLAGVAALLVIVVIGAGGRVLALAFGALLALIAVASYRPWHARLFERRNFVTIVSFGVVAVAIRIIDNPWRTGELLGSVAVFAAFLLVASYVVYAFAMVAERFQPPAAFTVLRFRRVPFFVLLAVWALLIGLFDRDGIYANARVVGASGPTSQLHDERLGVGRAFDEWAQEHATGVRPAPMLVVAAAGGGIRAAYWTAVVLRCVIEGEVLVEGSTQATREACRTGGEQADRKARASFFAASGISGGSLGLATYAAHRRGATEDTVRWAEDRLNDDGIAPVVGWALFVDLPMAFLRRGGGADRAEILERAWERAWLDEPPDQSLIAALTAQGPKTERSRFAKPFLERWSSRRARFPLLLLNGAKVQDGCRVNVSVLSVSVRPGVRRETPKQRPLVERCLALRLVEKPEDDAAGPGNYVPPHERRDWALASSTDLYDAVCREDDLRLSTAVLLSARFPWVLPSGRLHCKRENEEAINVVDGGYFDTSGASPVVELMSSLSDELARRDGPCIVPLYLQIDTGYADPVRASDKAPLETVVPPSAVRRARNAREHNARQAAALLFSGTFGRTFRAYRGGGKDAEQDRVVHIYPRAHPGARAPLGWTLSETAMTELRSQLRHNTGEIRKLREWFSGRLTCEDRPGS